MLCSNTMLKYYAQALCLKTMLSIVFKHCIWDACLISFTCVGLLFSTSFLHFKMSFWLLANVRCHVEPNPRWTWQHCEENSATKSFNWVWSRFGSYDQKYNDKLFNEIVMGHFTSLHRWFNYNASSFLCREVIIVVIVYTGSTGH